MNEIATDTSSATPAPAAAEDDTKKEDPFWKFLLKLALIVLIFRSFIFSPFSIPSESMLPRLWNGDHLFAAKWPYGFSKHSLPFSAPLIPGRIFASQPEAGDIAIFKHPVSGEDYVKRVIALPGDQVEMRAGQLVLNGQIVPKVKIADFEIPISANTRCNDYGELVTGDGGKPVCRYQRYRETLPNGRSYEVLDFGPSMADNFGPIVIPEGKMFLLGDNRDNSQDSRFPAVASGGIGLVDQDLLVGRASMMMWSTDGSAEWVLPWTWFSAARWGRIGDTF